jgi:glycosyltransferase involved in cell wall biosynthesis
LQKKEKTVIKILMIGPSANSVGPINRIMCLLREAIDNRGCHTSLSEWGGGNVGGIRKKIMERISEIINIIGLLRSRKYDLMFIHTAHDWNTIWRDIALILLSMPLCKRHIVMLHGSLSDRLTSDGNYLFKTLSKVIIKVSHYILVLSYEEMNQWKSFCITGRYEVVRNPYRNIDELEERGCSGARIAQDNVPIVLYVGRIIREKGIFDLIEAFSQVRKLAKCRLLISGNGRDMVMAKRYIERLKLGQDAEMLGYQRGKNLCELYRRAAIFVLPTYWPEGFPTVFMEAMSFGLPIVTTRIRGAADCLKEDHNAVFVPARNPNSLASAIYRLLRDEHLRRHIGSANMQKVKEFSPEVVCETYMSIIKNSIYGVELGGEMEHVS